MGNWKDEISDVEKVVIQYFRNIFTTTNPQSSPEILEAVSSRVSQDMNKDLMQEFRAEEVRTALFQMHPTKAPGPDEAFSALLLKAEARNRIQGVAVARNAPRISHLFFADDSLLFANATEEQALEISRIISLYGEASGQQINFDKSALSFSSNVPVSRKDEIKNILGVSVCSIHNKYLGLPSTIGRSKMQPFNIIRERVWRKLQGWKERLLSKAGREVLIKAVAQAIPTYMMSCFKLPVTICDAINKMICNFWWGQKGSERKLHWIRWEKLCKNKRESGAGLRDMEAFNLALLAKQAWRLLQVPNSLFLKVYKAKYFPHSSYFEAELGSCPSFTWRSILSACPIIERGSRWRVGSGSSLRVWGSRWLPSPSSFKVSSPRVPGCEDMLVCDLIDFNGMVWKEDLIFSLFLNYEALNICNIPLSSRPVPDRLIWHFTNNGLFSVKSAYPLAVQFLGKDYHSFDGECSSMNTVNSVWKSLWSLGIPNKIKNFLWRAVLNILPTGTRLADRKIPVDPRCCLCGGRAETPLHLFVHCPWTRLVWDNSEVSFPLDNPFIDFRHLFEFICLLLDVHALEICSVMFWLIWCHRNAVRHDSMGKDPRLIQLAAKDYVMEFQNAQVQLKVSVPAQVSVGASSWLPPPEGYLNLTLMAVGFSLSELEELGELFVISKGLLLEVLQSP
uniref:Reverse transcriptase zinc-binding domain-containing protein n=1 Tax=Davidia involucrata TaxID=16924 RepID=A0A5B7C6K9_DAVIN